VVPSITVFLGFFGASFAKKTDLARNSKNGFTSKPSAKPVKYNCFVANNSSKISSALVKSLSTALLSVVNPKVL